MPRRLSVLLQSAAPKPNNLPALSGTKHRHELSAPSASLTCDEFQIHRKNFAFLGSYWTLLCEQLDRTASVASGHCGWENITSNSTRKLRRNICNLTNYPRVIESLLGNLYVLSQKKKIPVSMVHYRVQNSLFLHHLLGLIDLVHIIPSFPFRVILILSSHPLLGLPSCHFPSNWCYVQHPLCVKRLDHCICITIM